MAEPLRLMGIFAHPDDESLGNGGTLAKYSSEGVETSVLVATRGEHGWFGDKADYPGPEELGRIREAELRDAADALGIGEVSFLDYEDGHLAEAQSSKAIAGIVDHVRRVRPHVALTFDAQGAYGHPDHIAISQLATSALVAAADPSFRATGDWPAHAVSKLYYMAWSEDQMAGYQAAFGDLVMNVDGEERRAAPWNEWAITTRIDTSAYWRRVWEAVSCHRSQLPGYQALLDLSESHHRRIWGVQTYYRAFSLVNGGRKIEVDLFAGLREIH